MRRLLRRNQGTLYDDVRLLLDGPERKALIAALRGDHGRIETRTASKTAYDLLGAALPRNGSTRSSAGTGRVEIFRTGAGCRRGRGAGQDPIG